jgi:hypothetical protein
MIIHGILTTARMRRLEFIQRTGCEPSMISMHPRVWMDVCEAAGRGEIDCSKWPHVELMGMQVYQDPTVPGIEMVVS